MKNRNLIMTCLTITVLAFASIFLTSLTTPSPTKPTMTRTYGGLGSNLNVYEYRSSEGYVYIIVQGNGEAGPVSVFR